MHIRRFEAASMREALRKVRQELGPDALVLSSRSVRHDRGWFGRFGRPVVEVTAAVDRDANRAGVEPRQATPDRSWNELRMTRSLVNSLEQEMRSVRGSIDRLAANPSYLETLTEDVAELRQLAAELSCARAALGSDPSVRSETGRYLQAGLAARHAWALGREAASRSSEAETAEERLVETLAEQLNDRMVLPPHDQMEGLVLYVGPTGVGKTTTVAKLAARDGSAGRPLGLISTDVHRINGEAPLRGYARRYGVPFESVVSPECLAESVKRLGRSRILVDTAGRSRADGMAIPDLQRLRSALGRRARVHLVLAATTKESDLQVEVQRYRPVKPDALVITKIDESGDLGNVASLLLDAHVPPLAWIGSGQRVPDDLIIPHPDEFAARVLGATA